MSTQSTGRHWLVAAAAASLLLALGCPTPVQKKVRVPPDAGERAVAPPEPSPEAAKWNWIASSRSGRVSVIQTATSPKVCTVECVRDPGHESLWKANDCLGTREQYHLVTDDGARMLVVEPAPIEQGSWRATIIITAYERGAPKVQLLASDIFTDDGKLVRFPESFQWLTGGRKLPVPPPKLVEGTSDQIELQLIDGRKAVVRFDGTIVSGARPVVVAPKAPLKPKAVVPKKKPRR